MREIRECREIREFREIVKLIKLLKFPIKKSESNSILLSLFDFIPTKSSTEATTKQPPTTILNRNGSATQKSHMIEGFLGRGVSGEASILFVCEQSPRPL